MYNWILICLAIYVLSAVTLFVAFMIGLKIKRIILDDETTPTFLATITLLPVVNTFFIIVSAIMGLVQLIVKGPTQGIKRLRNWLINMYIKTDNTNK